MNSFMVARRGYEDANGKALFYKGVSYEVLVVNTETIPRFFILNESDEWGLYDPNWFLPSGHPNAPAGK
jgi:hypothetical protein